MASDSDEDLLSLRRAAREMLDMARLKRLHLHGDWERASRLRLQGLSLLYDASRRFSIPRLVRGYTNLLKRSMTKEASWTVCGALSTGLCGEFVGQLEHMRSAVCIMATRGSTL
ncbi:hypothetical protein L915_12247 [Phytophthora nicotianae]|uniref:Uncharacterized protein n=1 Tax=Phytophthora nicotianae TaxID=4792 RepID=W2GH14_PHYNI|nr:hypothetical protein L915_12247 [Phytophthora nicotianae]